MNELFLQRLNKALDSLGFPVERGRNSEFVKRTGYSASQASGILAGKTRIADETMDRLEHRLGIRREWMLTGEGEMFLETKKEAGAFGSIPPELAEIYGQYLRGRSRDEQLLITERFVKAVAEVDLEKISTPRPQPENDQAK